MRVRTLGFLTLCVLAWSWSASAHHSHGNYDMQKYTNLKGTVKEVHWMNPHSWVYLEVADEKGGEPIMWSLEGASVTQLQRRGWEKDRLKPGDKIAVRCHQLRDGSNGCLLGFVTTADGEEKIFD